MSGKKAKKSAPKVSQEEAPRRPTSLGLLVLVAGGISTWYWYKPLPAEKNHGSYAAWSDAHGEGLWSSTDLIRPSLESLDAEFPGKAEQEVDGLIEDSKKLIPVPVYRKNLDELMAGEAVPTLPPMTQTVAVSNESSHVWTNSPLDTNPSPLSRNNLANRAESNARSLDWPDQGFVLSRQEQATPPSVASTAPSLLSTPTSNTQRLIRTNEGEFVSPQTFSETSYGLPAEQRASMAVKEANQVSEPPRAPQFIRQPRR